MGKFTIRLSYFVILFVGLSLSACKSENPPKDSLSLSKKPEKKISQKEKAEEKEKIKLINQLPIPIPGAEEVTFPKENKEKLKQKLNKSLEYYLQGQWSMLEVRYFFYPKEEMDWPTVEKHIESEFKKVIPIKKLSFEWHVPEYDFVAVFEQEGPAKESVAVAMLEEPLEGTLIGYFSLAKIQKSLLDKLPYLPTRDSKDITEVKAFKEKEKQELKIDVESYYRGKYKILEARYYLAPTQSITWVAIEKGTYSMLRALGPTRYLDFEWHRVGLDSIVTFNHNKEDYVAVAKLRGPHEGESLIGCFLLKKVE